MRIEQLELTNFRGTEHAVVDFRPSGITVLVGPNEIGKSSIMEGFRILLEFLDSSKHQRVLNTKPVDVDEGPQVFARIRAGEYLFEVSKRWLKRPQTNLRILEPVEETNTFTSREAHEKLLEILDANLDRDLLRALQHELGDAEKPRSFSSKSLTSALDKAAGGETLTDTGEAESLWERVEAEYLRYFTKAGKPNSERTSASEKVERLESTASDLETRINELVSEGELFERLAAEERSAKLNQYEITKRLHELQLEWSGIEGVIDEQKSAKSALALAEAKITQSTSTFDDRARLTSSAESLRTTLKNLEDQRDNVRGGGAALIKKRDDAVQEAESAEEEVDSAEAIASTASLDVDHLRRVLDVEMLRERAGRLAEARTKQQELTAELQTLTIDDVVLAEIVAAHNEKTEADARLQSAAFSVRVEALDSVDVAIDGKTVSLSKGESEDLKGSDGLELTIDDKVKVSVAGTHEQTTLAADAKRATKKLNKLLERHGVPVVEGLSGAQELSRRRDAALNELTGIEGSTLVDLRDLGTEVIEDKIARNQLEIDQYLESRPGEPALPKDLDVGKAAHEDAVEDLVKARAKAASARSSRDVIRDLANSHESELNVLDARVADADTRLAESVNALEAARSAEPDEALAIAKSAAEEELQTAKETLGSVESRLSQLNSESVKAQLDAAQESVVSANDRVAGLEIQLATSRTKLEVLGREGLKSDLDEVEADLNHDRRVLQSLERRAAAAQLLFERMRERRDAANRNYVAPFAKQIDGLGRIVFGHDASFDIDPGSLELKALVRDGKRIPYESLSTGTKEQCQLLASLATAQLTSNDGSGAPVVLDDALGSTDPERIEKVGAVLASAAKECQIIILTCDPTRYRGVGSPSIVSVGIDTRQGHEAAEVG